MRIVKLLVTSLALACVACLVACKTAESSPTAGEAKNVLYVCDCGAECKCTTKVSLSPGKCGCGHELKLGHLVRVDGDTASLCMCGKSCKCTANAQDSTKCGCGQPLQKVDLKGTGIYYCNCGGGTCTCNTVSGKPGKCGCGMELKQG